MGQENRLIEYERKLKKSKYFVRGLFRFNDPDQIINFSRRLDEQFNDPPGEMLESMPPWLVIYAPNLATCKEIKEFFETSGLFTKVTECKRRFR